MSQLFLVKKPQPRTPRASRFTSERVRQALGFAALIVGLAAVVGIIARAE